MFHSEQPELGMILLMSFVGSVIGFYIGRATATAPAKAVPIEYDDSDDEDRANAANNNISVIDSNEQCKLVLVVRTDVGMTKGKIAAQCSHATLACYKSLKGREAKLTSRKSSLLHHWESRGQAKVTTQVKSEDELRMLQAQAISLGLTAKIIHDAGRTQIASGTATVLGIGPGPISLVNQVTGSLKLL